MRSGLEFNASTRVLRVIGINQLMTVWNYLNARCFGLWSMREGIITMKLLDGMVKAGKNQRKEPEFHKKKIKLHVLSENRSIVGSTWYRRSSQWSWLCSYFLTFDLLSRNLSYELTINSVQFGLLSSFLLNLTFAVKALRSQLRLWFLNKFVQIVAELLIFSASWVN